MDSLDIAIIGGGPGGLITAYLLEHKTRFAKRVTVFEATGRLGGKLVTARFGSAPVSYEAGAAELYDYSQLGPDPLRELIEELGVTTLPMGGDVVIMDNRLLRNSADVRHEFGNNAFQALQSFTKRACASIDVGSYYESDWNLDNADPLFHRSFAELLDEVTDENARKFLEIAVHSDLATEPDKTNATYGLQNYLMNFAEYMRLYTVEEGLERLPKELAKRIAAEIRLEQPVVSVERTEDETYRVVSRRHGIEVVDEFDAVVVALPNNWIPLIEWRGPLLSKAMRQHQAHYAYPAHYLRVSMLFDRPFWRDQVSDSYFMIDAFGGCCVYDEGARLAGPEGFGILGCLLAGEAAMTLSNLDDATLVTRVFEALPARLNPGRARLLEGRVHRWLDSVNGLPGGRPLREPDSRHVPEPTEHPWLFVVGDYLFDSTLNGVVDSADTVVQWIAEDVEDEAQQVAALVKDPAASRSSAPRSDAPADASSV